MTRIRTKNASYFKVRGRNWIMAIDPFSDLPMEPFIKFAHNFAEDSGKKLAAAYVLAPASFNWLGEFSGPWIKKYLPLAEAKMDSVVGDYPYQVIKCRQSGVKASAESLVRYAQRSKAEGLIIATHGRRGLERWALGSFAETVIQLSKIPVLILNPSAPLPIHVEKVLALTDCGKESKAFVKDVARLSKSLGAELALYYKMPDPLDPIVQQGIYTLGGGWVSLPVFVRKDLEEKTKTMDQLAQLAKRSGVETKVVLDTWSPSLSDGIRDIAQRENPDLICLVTRAGPLAATILGSVARELLRTSDIPLLVKR